MYIYGLFSTKDKIIRYVGQTMLQLKIRLKQHISDALKKRTDTYKDRWIRKCYENGFEINIVPIETVTEENINEREIYWIKKIPNLTNTTSGGEGGYTLLKYDKSYDYCKNWLKENAPEVKSTTQYYKFTKQDNFPSFLPKKPNTHFKTTNEWVNWGDFLLSGREQDNKKALKYLNYKEAKRFLKPLGILTIPQYKNFVKENNIEFLPMRPDRYYCNRGWDYHQF